MSLRLCQRLFGLELDRRFGLFDFCRGLRLGQLELGLFGLFGLGRRHLGLGQLELLRLDLARRLIELRLGFRQLGVFDFARRLFELRLFGRFDLRRLDLPAREQPEHVRGGVVVLGRRLDRAALDRLGQRGHAGAAADALAQLGRQRADQRVEDLERHQHRLDLAVGEHGLGVAVPVGQAGLDQLVEARLGVGEPTFDRADQLGHGPTHGVEAIVQGGLVGAVAGLGDEATQRSLAQAGPSLDPNEGLLAAHALVDPHAEAAVGVELDMDLDLGSLTAEPKPERGLKLLGAGPRGLVELAALVGLPQLVRVVPAQPDAGVDRQLDARRGRQHRPALDQQLGGAPGRA